MHREAFTHLDGTKMKTCCVKKKENNNYKMNCETGDRFINI